MWVDIKGYKWPYRINEEGEVQKQEPNGTWTDLHPYLGTARARVKMRTVENKKVDIPVVWLMADAFFGGRRPGMCMIHKNGFKLDCSRNNLVWSTYSDSAKRSRNNRCKPVVKLDKKGHIVEVYKSGREAARANFISQNAICDRCNNLIKDPFKLDGYNYQYEGVSKSMSKRKKKRSPQKIRDRYEVEGD